MTITLPDALTSVSAQMPDPWATGQVDLYERELSQHFGTAEAIAVASGTGVSANRATTATTPPREILLCGGGIDSFVAWHYLGKPQALYFDLGDRNRDQEYRALDTLARRHGIRLPVSRELDLGSWELQDGVIPLRHLHLAVLACHRADTVWCIAVKGNLGADRSSAAFERLSKLISEVAGRDIRIDSPFRDMTKTEVVHWYVDQSLPVDDLLQVQQLRSPGQHVTGATAFLATICVGIGDNDTADMVAERAFPSSRDARSWVEQELPVAEFPIWVAKRPRGTAGAFLFGAVQRGHYVPTAEGQIAWQVGESSTDDTEAYLVDGQVRWRGAPNAVV
ncbi:hypothetical protein [Amycolatopsis sp. H20-H5]|uniref:hypothetical protein n=1 Tax=Amycolatopsis sp. H20-H5 TaxID=3046309 RepID=UPI002DBFDF19|nr:hypothetical protein [Amycolatopsis sp. H20-H5]MEC3978912.1 hypothetical protein [Amycolatopsis sp. H20-H5]